MKLAYQIRIGLALLSIGWFFAVSAARAHDADYSLSTVEWNAQTQSLEVIHRLHAHHAIDLARKAMGGREMGAAGLEGLAALGLYCQERFEISAENGDPISLEFVGAQLEGDFALIYFEAPWAHQPAAIGVRSALLMDVTPWHRSQVNIAMGSRTRTVILSKARPTATLNLRPVGKQMTQ